MNHNLLLQKYKTIENSTQQKLFYSFKILSSLLQGQWVFFPSWKIIFLQVATSFRI